MNDTVVAPAPGGANLNKLLRTGASRTPADQKKLLVDFAHELGFDSCRVAACVRPPHADKFQAWLRHGAHGEMHYMARGEEKRTDPERILPGAKSIVVLGLNYFQGHPTPKAFAAATG